MMRRLMHCWLSLMLACAAVTAWAQEPRLLVVRSDVSPAYEQANQSLIETLTRGGVAASDLEVMSPDQFVRFSKTGAFAAVRLVVSLGSAATEVVLAQRPAVPVLAGLVPRLGFEQMLRTSHLKTSSQLTAVYFDQPLKRQLALIRLAWPQARQVGVLLGPQSGARLDALRHSAATLDLALSQTTVARDQELFAALQRVLVGSDVLLALADPWVFNSATVQNILLTSYRARVPMVAFAPAYARAGAVLSLFTPPVLAGKQLASLALGALRSGKLPAQPVDPDDFALEVNQSVARSLGLVLDPEELRRQLSMQEGAR